MGESERYQEYKHLKKPHYTLGHPKNAIMALMILNAVFFLTLYTIQVFFHYTNQSVDIFHQSVMQWIELPSGFSRFLDRPWTIFTYMFADSSASIWRLVSNMLWLAAFGYLLQEITDNDKLIPIYLYGGLTSGLFFMLSHLIFTSAENHALLGANGALMSVAVATVSMSPNHRFYRHIGRGIPVWVLLIFYLFIDFSTITTLHPSYMLAHVGGALSGLLFTIFLKKGIDGSVWMNKLYRTMSGIFTPSVSNSNDLKKKIFYETGHRAPFSKTSRATPEKVDEILDKINSRGYDFLTEEEKQILKKASEEGEL